MNKIEGIRHRCHRSTLKSNFDIEILTDNSDSIKHIFSEKNINRTKWNKRSSRELACQLGLRNRELTSVLRARHRQQVCKTRLRDVSIVLRLHRANPRCFWSYDLFMNTATLVFERFFTFRHGTSKESLFHLLHFFYSPLPLLPLFFPVGFMMYIVSIM